MPLTRFIAAALTLCACAAVAAPQADDDTCHNFAGQRINTPECIAFLKAQQPLSDMECYASEVCRAETAARNQAREARRRQKQQDEEDQRDRAEAAEQRKANARTAALKAKCGADYKSPRIGMPIARAQECVTPMRVTSQLSRKDGVVTTYEGGGAYFHVMDGVILAWGR